MPLPSYQFGLSYKAISVIKKALMVSLFGLLLTPLLLSSRFFFPYITTKTFFFRLLVEIALALYLPLALADANYRPRWNRISLALTVFLAIVMITGIFGANFYRSFWGNTERGEGIVTLLHLAAFFAMLSGAGSTMSFWTKFFSFEVLTSFASAIYAALQKLGASFVIAGDVSRLSALVGNASFYAGYLLLNIFLCVWLAYIRPKIWQKVFFVSVAVYELVILVMTGTRGAMVAFAVGAVLALAGFAFTSGGKKQKIAFAAAALLVVFSYLGLWSLRNTDMLSGAGGLNRIASISLGDITTQSRLLTWQASWKGFADRFFSGYGYENFNVAFNKYFPAEIFRDSGSQIWFDRAHNVFFDVAVSTGVFGIAAYLSIYLAGFFLLWRFYRRDREKNRVTFIIFSVLLISYFIQNLFVFDTMGTYLVFYSVLAFIASSALLNVKPQVASRSEQRRIPGAVPALLALAVVGCSYFTVFAPVKANLAVMDGLVAVNKKDLPKTIDAFEKAIASGTFVKEEARQKFAESMLGFRNDSSFSEEIRERGLRDSLEEMRNAVEAAPQDARNYLFLAAVYNNLITSEPGSREEVIRLGRKVLELSPTRPQAYFEMGQAAFFLGRFDEGIGYFKKAVALNPFPAESHWNLAVASAIAGRFDETDSEIAYSLSPERANNITDASLYNLIKIFENKQQLERTLPLYDILLARRSKDPDLFLGYASVLGRLCKVEQAEKLLAPVSNLGGDYAAQASALKRMISGNCAKR